MAATKKGEVVALQALFSVTRYLGAFTTATTDLGGGTEVPSTNNYARATLPSMTITESGVEEDPSEAVNADVVQWPEASGSWGTITHVGVFTAATGGDMIAHSALDAAREILDGDTLRFLAGKLKFTAD